MRYPVAYRQNSSSTLRAGGSQSLPGGQTAFRPPTSGSGSRLPTAANDNLPRAANDNLPKRPIGNTRPFGTRLPTSLAARTATSRIGLGVAVRLGARFVPMLGWAMLAYDLWTLLGGLPGFFGGAYQLGPGWTKQNACPDTGSAYRGVRFGSLANCGFDGNMANMKVPPDPNASSMHFSFVTSPGTAGFRYRYHEYSQYLRTGTPAQSYVRATAWPWAPMFPPAPAPIPFTPNYPIPLVNPFPNLNPAAMPLPTQPSPEPLPLPGPASTAVINIGRATGFPFPGPGLTGGYALPPSGLPSWPYPPPDPVPLPVPEVLPPIDLANPTVPLGNPGQHENVPPGPRVKERKFKLQGASTALSWFNALSEFDDAVDYFYWAIEIPRNRQDDVWSWEKNRWIRRGRDLKYDRPRDRFWKDKNGNWHRTGVGLGQKLEFIYKHAGDISVEKLIKNIARGEATDFAFGKLGQANKKAVQQLHDRGYGSSPRTLTPTRTWWSQVPL